MNEGDETGSVWVPFAVEPLVMRDEAGHHRLEESRAFGTTQLRSNSARRDGEDWRLGDARRVHTLGRTRIEAGSPEPFGTDVAHIGAAIRDAPAVRVEGDFVTSSAAAHIVHARA